MMLSLIAQKTHKLVKLNLVNNLKVSLIFQGYQMPPFLQLRACPMDHQVNTETCFLPIKTIIPTRWSMHN